MLDNKPELQVEYEALTGRGGCVPLSGWSSVTLTGSDRAAFLHNFCTNDVKRLQPGDACEAFLTDVKGKILGHGSITCHTDALVLVTVPGQSAGIIEHLDRYLIREDVRLQETTADRHFSLVTGPSAAGVARASGLTAFPCNWLSNIQALLVEGKLTPDLCAKHGLAVCGADAFETARVEAGFPLYGVDFDRSNLPQEIARDRQAISFTKGCYLGQETVARIDALGHVNRLLVGVRFASSDVPRTPVELMREGAAVGQATSVVYSPRLNAPLGLAIVRREVSEPGTSLTSAGGDCQVVALPVA